MLRNDYYGPVDRVNHVRLDDDSGSSVPAGISDIPGVPSGPSPGATVNPLVAVRERIPDGTSESGNQLWKWITVLESTEAIGWSQRIEEDDDSSNTLEVANFTILWPDSLPPIRESAQILTLSDGHSWPVSNVERFPGRVRLEVRRIDSGR